jgi:catechol 2,3-dioxygenase-like lactoylglutathione lyase family enzyme
MATIDHVTLRVRDVQRSLEFYARVFELLDFDGEGFNEELNEWDDFSFTAPDADHGVTTRLHVGFAAASRAQVDGWWRGLTHAGYRDDGSPGPRPEYGADYYGGFVTDLDGNSIEAVHHSRTTRAPGLIDHLWIRVRDLAKTRRLYEAVAPALGLRVRERPGRLQLVAEGSSISFLEAERPTENLHLAFGVDDAGTVSRFYEAGLGAGATDNGPPGERPEYHLGYFGAFLLDADGTNVEAVWHDRH